MEHREERRGDILIYFSPFYVAALVPLRDELGSRCWSAELTACVTAGCVVLQQLHPVGRFLLRFLSEAFRSAAAWPSGRGQDWEKRGAGEAAAPSSQRPQPELIRSSRPCSSVLCRRPRDARPEKPCRRCCSLRGRSVCRARCWLRAPRLAQIRVLCGDL